MRSSMLGGAGLRVELRPRRSLSLAIGKYCDVFSRGVFSATEGMKALRALMVGIGAERVTPARGEDTPS